MKPAVSVTNLSKQYQLGPSRNGGYRTFRDTLAEAAGAAKRRLGRLWRRGPKPDDMAKAGEKLWALRDVSFEVQPGEMVGVIGRNGAGKSTMLKILSRITEPTAGRLELCGQVGSLLEVGTGFHPELTGRENIYLNGAILGMARKDIDRKFDAIVEFSELAKFIDTPVKRYSSGMYVRLAFAVSAHMEPNILLLDEVLSVGDLAFQRKCMEHAKGLRSRGATVLFVSHNMFSIKAMCDRVVYLSQGRVRYDGPAEEGIHLYEKENRLGTAGWAAGLIGTDPSMRPVSISDIELLDEGGHSRSSFEHGERMRVRLHFQIRQPVPEPNFCICLIRSDGVVCCNHNTVLDGFPTEAVSGPGSIEVLTPALKLVSELYELHVLIWDRKFQHLYTAQVGPSFHVRDQLLSTHFGVFHEPAEWSWGR